MLTPPIDAETRASGGPVENPDHDDFERVKFAQRIAETLIKRRSQKSIVVGLYGKWGEGKSSVLHFIKRTLAEADDQIAVLNFNPWRFPNETQLLVNFFVEPAKIVGQNLHTPGQRAAQAFSSYVAPLVPTVSYNDVSVDFSKGVESLLKLGQPEIDEQRKRIETLIRESGKRVVVIIDDIDRLEKTQIQAVFRLVKLTADFDQTSYLLSFDDEMVARAIGEVFAPSADDAIGSRTLLAGQSFLEKIIQVPLRLPRAQPDDLLQFCWNRLREVLDGTGIMIEKADMERLSDVLISGILPRLSTPRMAVRFANAVQFSLPLLEGEVDVVDQILVEGMHIFYPQLHQFVATHQSDFVGDFDVSASDKRKGVIEAALITYQGDERRGALSLLCNLFPAVNGLFVGAVPFLSRTSLRNKNTATRPKGIAYASHFARYFAYSVVRGDVSDREFEDFLKAEPVTQLPAAWDLLGRLGVNRFLQKLEYLVQSLSANEATNVWLVIAEVSSKFSGTDGPVRPWLLTTQSTIAVRLMHQLLLQIEGSKVRSQLVESLIESGSTFEFAKEFQYELRRTRRYDARASEEESSEWAHECLFSPDEWQRLMDEVIPLLFLKRALKEAGVLPLYKTHPLFAFQLLFNTWPRANFTLDVATYVRSFLTQSPDDIHDVVAVCSSSIGTEGRYYLANVTRHQVAAVTQLFGSYLYDEVRRVIGNEPVTSYPGDEEGPDEPTSETRLRQFVYLYENQESTPSVTE